MWTLARRRFSNIEIACRRNFVHVLCCACMWVRGGMVALRISIKGRVKKGRVRKGRVRVRVRVEVRKRGIEGIEGRIGKGSLSCLV